MLIIGNSNSPTSSKPVAALAALQLVEEGRVDLDADG